MPFGYTPALQIQKNDGTLAQLCPRTTTDQILNPPFGKSFGPFILTLKADGWTHDGISGMYICALPLADIIDTDIPYVCCAYNIDGDMKATREAYNLLNPKWGVQSFNGYIQFACNKDPTIDFDVQVTWTR